MRMCKDCGHCYHGPNKKCPNCGSLNTMGATDKESATPGPQTRICKQCGTIFKGTVKCPQCGSRDTVRHNGPNIQNQKMKFQEANQPKNADLIQFSKSALRNDIELYAGHERVIFIREETGEYRTPSGFKPIYHKDLQNWVAEFEPGIRFDLPDLPICGKCGRPHKTYRASLCQHCAEEAESNRMEFDSNWGGVPSMFSIENFQY